MFYSPLHCAQLLADDARQKKGPKPTVISVRRSCDGNLFAVVSYTSGTKADSFPVLVKHDGVELRPRSDKLAVEPIVSRRQTTSFQTEYTYSYRDQLFTFNLLDPWTYKVTVQYVLPETGDATYNSSISQSLPKTKLITARGIRPLNQYAAWRGPRRGMLHKES